MDEGSPPDGTSPEAWQSYLELKDLPPAGREYRMAVACREDPTLQREVARLLQEQEDQGWLFQTGDLLGDQYEVIRPIGRGGLSEVYLTIRLDDEERGTDAVKILRGGDYDGLARAEREGLRLRDLQHENIPGYRDHGTLPTGQPFLAMEYIHGLPIDLYCEKNELSIRARLRLFLHVCSAVSFLHQKRLLHRDLKPSNILVTDAGVPKVLDFNISKRLPQNGGADQTLTAGRVMPPFTANYASPEQIIGRYLDQSSDVYSLGAVLYKLLTGEVPADLGHLLDHPEELRRAALKEEIGPPSSLAIEPVDRDLDIIVMKALRKSSDERYRSVEELQNDISRLLTNRPILAKNPSWGYFTKKFIQRNWRSLSFAIALLLVVLSFGVAMAVEKERTAREKETANQVLDLLTQLLKSTDPNKAPAAPKELLDQGLERIRTQLEDLPEAKARLFAQLGLLFLEWGEYEKAESLVSEALEFQQRTLPPDHPELIASLYTRAEAAYHLGDFEEAKRHLHKSLRAKKSRFGNEDPRLSDELVLMAVIAHKESDLVNAEHLITEAIRLRRLAVEDNDASMGALYHNRGAIYRTMGEYEKAEVEYKKALEVHRAHVGEDNPQIAFVTTGLAGLQKILGKNDLAEANYRKALEIRRSSLSEDHFLVATSLNNLGLFLRDQGRNAEAEPLLLKGLAIQEQHYGKEHPQTGVLLTNLGLLIQAKGDFDSAEHYFLRAIKAWEKLPQPNLNTTKALVNLGRNFRNQGKYEEAEKMLRRAMNDSIKLLGTDNVEVSYKQRELGRLLLDLERYEEAEVLLRSVSESFQSIFGPTHKMSDTALIDLARLYAYQGELDSAEPLFREVIEENEADTNDSRELTATKMTHFAEFLLLRGEYNQALLYGKRARKKFEGAYPEQHWTIAWVDTILWKASSCLGYGNSTREEPSASIGILESTFGSQSGIFKRSERRRDAACL